MPVDFRQSPDFAHGGCCGSAGLSLISNGRREFFSKFAALGLGAMALPSVGCSSPADIRIPIASGRGLIDVHHHPIPPFCLAENHERPVRGVGKLTLHG
jgi:hypothetical protein